MSRKRGRVSIDLDTGNTGRHRSTVISRGIFLTDGLRQHHNLTSVPVKKARLDPLNAGDAFAGWKPMPQQRSTETETGPSETETGTTKRYISSTNPMAQWRPLKGMFLDEILRHEGLGNDHEHPTCAHCHRQPSQQSPLRLFRCTDCGLHLQCLECCLSAHLRFPLHSLKEWNGTFWDHETLVNIGLVYQLGHGGFPCPFPDVAIHKMTIIDAPIIHTVQIRCCNCPHSQEADFVRQLLRNAWYPATVLEPATCATFRTLQAFRLYNVVGNLNVSDFTTAMERMTTSLGVARSRQLQRMSRQWAHLTRLKRSGRAHNTATIDATPLGACAVNCWACPHEGRNLPPNWRTAEPELQFLYMLILAIDTNFRLKNRIRANEIDDLALGPGWGYWVEPTGYQEHVKKYVNESDMSTCIAFAALLQKDTRMTTGLRVSGVGGCVCARHECMRPNGLGDLQKGERYCNMDWILFSAIMTLTLLFILISYDIACQWKVHVADRMTRLPAHMQQNLDEVTLQYGLPVWHADSHRADCRDQNKISYQPGAAKTDGEAIERVWADLNPASFSTKEMGLGSRADMIDDRVDNHNFLKNMTLGSTLQRRLLLARDELKHQVDAFKAASDGVEPSLQKVWKKQIRDWEADNSQPNPYVLPHSGFPTESKIRVQLQQEEREQNIDGRASIAGSSATAFLSAGIQIQDTQYRIKEQLAETTLLTADRQIKIQESRDAVYMPGAAAAMSTHDAQRDNEAPPPAVEDIMLWMPSDMPPGPNGFHGCLPELPVLEEKLRVSQCENSLSQLRFTLHGKRWLIAYRNANVVGQVQSTRAAKLLSNVTARGLRLAERYRRGFTALCGLGSIHKHERLLELKADDIRLEVDHDQSDLDASKKLAIVGGRGNARPIRNMRNVGSSRRVMSWIWTAPGAFDNEEQQLHETMRVEWARAFARKSRWSEEVKLLEEEMRRVLRYLSWEADWWRSQASQRQGIDAALSGALLAYASQRASQSECIMMHFRIKWCAFALLPVGVLS
ncbi:hypothetical protein C8F01DRAFT_1303976 [Mycena amicta]|nr:hypothetical protein C8F01DRAFT_1303976 [Mycena amicta]